MKYAVIDIGSNSVRLMISEELNTEYKLVEMTRLAEGMGNELTLKSAPMERSARVICSFKQIAEKEKVDKIFVFATAAVRKAVNKAEFIALIEEKTGLDLDIITGEDEAEMGINGALNGKDGGIIDIGGASTEIIVVNNGKKIYSKSIDIGVVKIKDNCGQDKIKANKYIDSFLDEFGEIPLSEFIGIGGTATSLASMIQELEPYDPVKIQGFRININQLKCEVDKLFSMSAMEKSELKGLQPERAEVIAGGAMLLLKILEKTGVKYITVSERDNLEGYLMKKRERL